MHPCMAKGTGTSIDELRRNAKYIRALLSGYSINSSGRKYKDNPEYMRINFCIDFPTAFKLFLPESRSMTLVRHFYGIKIRKHSDPKNTLQFPCFLRKNEKDKFPIS